MPTEQDPRPRIGQIFRFLSDYQKIRTPPVRQLTEYDWHLFFADLPKDPSIQVGQIVPNRNITPEADEKTARRFILHVRRPKETACPPPPGILRDWIVPGWLDIDGDAINLDKRNLVVAGNTVTERFDDNPERMRALEDWRYRRQNWMNAERPVRAAMKVYQRLFELRGRLARP